MSLAVTDFPAGSGWSLQFSFRAPEASAIDFSSVRDGQSDKHLVNIPAAVTSGWKPALYTGVIKATDGTSTATVWNGDLTVNPDLAAQPEGFDSRSWARRCLDAIEAVLENRASKFVLNTTIAGQSLGRMTPQQLWDMRDRFKTEVEQELARDAANQGKHARHTIGITFSPL